MFNLCKITNENNKENHRKWPFIPDHLYIILVIGGSGSGKTNVLLNLIKEQNHIVKIYLYAKYLSEPRYERLIKKREHARIKYLNKTSNGIYERSNTMDGVYEDIDDLWKF